MPALKKYFVLSNWLGYYNRKVNSNEAIVKRFGRKLASKDQLAEIISTNRAALATVDRWIEDDVYEQSVFQYGLPEHVRSLIDKPLNEEVIYSDIISFLSKKIDNINYFELGVSVGKNFYIMANAFENANLTGFDIEAISPALEEKFKQVNAVFQSWDTKKSLYKKGPSTLANYQYKSNSIKYLCGDVFDEGSWEKLKGQKFNIIFSDACHSPEGLDFEYKMLRKYELIDLDQFVYFFDDLGGPMTKQFLEIFNDMKEKDKLSKSNVAVNFYNGWLGQHERPHLNGVIYKL